MFFTIHLAPNIMIGLTIASGVLLNLNILRDNIPLMDGNIPVVLEKKYKGMRLIKIKSV